MAEKPAPISYSPALPLRSPDELAATLTEPVDLPGGTPQLAPPISSITFPAELPAATTNLLLQNDLPFFHRYFREAIFWRRGWTLIEDPLEWEIIHGWVFLNLGYSMGWNWIYIPRNFHYHVYFPAIGGFLNFGYLQSQQTLIILRDLVERKQLARLIVPPGRHGLPRELPAPAPAVAPALPATLPLEDLQPKQLSLRPLTKPILGRPKFTANPLTELGEASVLAPEPMSKPHVRPNLLLLPTELRSSRQSSGPKLPPKLELRRMTRPVLPDLRRAKILGELLPSNETASGDQLIFVPESSQLRQRRI
ncbi:MAG: hypothetical protein HY692_03340 [Cyanobacteria bacterium NC_groundwater_1444_Ag_S-0.65um_54_12]|nr:hypothetical protein [Cyanobacteria bacterium NC_groundwater_1444_Ag_S-0.65um_54_12]